MKTNQILRFLMFIVLLISIFVGSILLSKYYYYDKSENKLFEIYDKINLGITKEEAVVFCERNKIFGMSIIEGKHGSIDLGIQATIQSLGAKGSCWWLFLDFESNKLSRAQMLDVSNEEGYQSKRLGNTGVVYYEKNLKGKRREQSRGDRF